MPSSSYNEELLEKIRSLPSDKIAEVEDFVDFLRSRPKQFSRNLEDRLRFAVYAGLITPPEPGQQRSSITDAPPLSIPGKSLSEIALESRR
jgi:hypothetical protein